MQNRLKPCKMDTQNGVKMQEPCRVDIAKKFKVWYTVLNKAEGKVEYNEQKVIQRRRNCRT